MLQISPATVSLALNNKSGVSEETRRQILELKDSSLRKDLRQLSGQAFKGVIGLLVYKKHGDIISETPFFVTLTEVVDQQAGRNSYGLNISYYTASKNINTYLESLNQSDISGLIVLATEMSSDDVHIFQRYLKKPFVLMDAYFPGDRVDAVLMDNRSGIMQAMDYGYALGHRKIGFIKSKMPSNNFIERFYSYKIGLDRLGLQYDPTCVFEVPASVDGAYNEMTTLLKNGVLMPSLLIAANDMIALGAANALKAAGVDIPGDISLIGFDDMPTSQYLHPPLTSVRLKHEVIGRLAVKRLVEKIENPKTAAFSVQEFVEVELIRRESTGAPK